MEKANEKMSAQRAPSSIHSLPRTDTRTPVHSPLPYIAFPVIHCISSRPLPAPLISQIVCTRAYDWYARTYARANERLSRKRHPHSTEKK